ncbi:MAG TPA: ISAzo13 family transposase, partial [bacterium]|nr:ISAzo13 family transposase [bacterium]
MIKEAQKIIGTIRKKFEQISYCLNEKAKRIWAASEAKILGHGGIKILHAATDLDYKTIKKGISEIQKNEKSEGIRKKGGGRKKLTYSNNQLLKDIEELV